MRDCSKSAFNLTIWILTKEGLPKLLRIWRKFKKTHTYVYSACHPMIAITVFDAKASTKGKDST